MVKRLAIVGGGAKAVAIAAKAHIFNEAGKSDCEVHVFEDKRIGASWSGDHGYTDGDQLLCTPAEKDLGFPYSTVDYIEHGAASMMGLFSWEAYKTDKRSFGRWVDDGRQSASHADFSSYLQWAFGRTKAKLHKTSVKGLLPTGTAGSPRWRIRAGNTSRLGKLHFDGVVVTGHGPAKSVNDLRSDRIVDGRDFWLPAIGKRLLLLLQDAAYFEDYPVVVIGSGGTAASILAWLARNGFKNHTIIILATNATFFSRGDSTFENRLFSDPGHWKNLSHATQDAFFDRISRGVVWEAVMQDLIRLTGLRFVEGRVDGVRFGRGGRPVVSWNRNLSMADETRGREKAGEIEAGLLVNATGFDSWWYLDLLPIGTIPADPDKLQDLKEKLETGMREDLSFGGGWSLPKLHAPWQSLRVGPGFSSLLALGDMADRIVGSYLKVERAGALAGRRLPRREP